MGWISSIGKRVGHEAGNLVGLELNKRGVKVLRNQWNHAKRKDCPACDKGLLYPFTEVIEGKKTKFLGCNSCDHFQAVNVARDEGSIKRLRAIADKKINGMSDDSYSEQIKNYQLGSRFYYLLASGAFGIATYMLFFSENNWTAFNIVLVSILLFVKGMVSSYRYWQLKTKTFYVPGAFLKWMKLGQWLI